MAQRSSSVRRVLWFLAVMIAVVMAASATAPVAKPANGATVFLDNFDRDADTFTGSWSSQNACADDRLTTDSTLKRGGTHSLKLTVKDGDVSPCTATSNPRSQVGKNDLFADGSERWMGHSTYFPSDFPTIGRDHWLIFSSYGFRAPYNGSAPGKFRVKSGTSDSIEYGRDERYGHDAIWEGKIKKGDWNDLVVHIKFSTDPAVGYVEIYSDGSLQTLKNGKTRFYYATLKPDQTGAGSWNVSQYRSKGAASEITLHQDEVKVGTSYDEVAPTSTPTTDTSAPKVTAVTPLSGATGVPRNPSITAPFSKDMAPSTLTATNVKFQVYNNRKNRWISVAHAVSYNETSKKAIVTPGSTLSASKKYRVIVTTNVKSSTGVALDQNSSVSGDQQKYWTFTTRRT